MSSSKICVVCISERRDVMNLFSLYYGSIPASTFIMDILQIKVASDTGIRVVMCNRCNSSLNNFYKFYKMVRDAQHKYNEMKLQLQDVVVRSGEICFVNVKPEPEVSPEGMEVESMKEEYLEDEEGTNAFIQQNYAAIVVKPYPLDVTFVSETKPDTKITNKKAETRGKRKPISKVTPRSKKATETLLSKYKVEDIFSGGEWKISEEEKDEIFQLYIDMKCTKCDAHFSNYNLLDQHCTTIHDESALVTCDDFTLPSYQHMERHILYKHILRARVVKPDIMIKCLVCSRPMKGIYWKFHMATHIPIDERDFRCNKCSAAFGSLGVLNRHIKNTHASTKVTCKLCGSLHRNKRSLADHVRHSHGSSDVRILCPDCGKVFRSSSNFSIHRKKHRGIVEKVKCKICNKVVNKANFSTHMIYHTPSRMKQCPHCPYRGICLTYHKRVHDGTKPFGCPLCNRRFYTKQAMEKHKHNTGEPCTKTSATNTAALTTYTCKYCSETFEGIRIYNAHCRKMHKEHFAETVRGDIKSHYCTLCDKSYTRKGVLEEHIAAIHMGVPKYQCEFCDKRLICSKNAKRHARKMHPEQFAAKNATQDSGTSNVGEKKTPPKKKKVAQ